MKRPTAFPRRRPGPADDAPQVAETPSALASTVDARALLLAHLSDSIAAASAMPPPSGAAAAADGIDAGWRVRLSEIGEAAGLTGQQEAEFERLARDQVDRIHTQIPALLRELRPHFDTPGEVAAKQRYEEGLRALKAQLDREAEDVLHRLGLAADAG